MEVILITLPVRIINLSMKTSIMNGLNSSQLNYNYMISYRPKISPKFEIMEKSIYSVFNNINFEHLIYFWEKDKLISKYHSHILLQSNSENLTSELYLNIKGKSIIYNGKRELLIKIPNITGFKDKRIEVDFTEFQGSLGKVHIEPIVEKINSCYYVSKFSDRGIISGFLCS